jgi:1-acyl-sn-glycerol-3-phosphate acyltransferase
MKTLRSLLFYLGYYSVLAPHTILCVIFGLFMSLKTRYHYFLIWNAFSLWWLRITCGVRWQVTGMENVPSGAFVMLSNHQSPWETLFLYWEFLPVCAILKKELLKIPFFGWALRLLNPIAIDRSKKARSLQQLMEKGKANLADGISVLVFPEGTRVAPGMEKKYSAGGAELAIAAGKPIVPVAHNAGLFWPAHKIIKHAGTIQVVIGKPIDTTGKDAREVTREIEAWTRQAIQAD